MIAQLAGILITLFSASGNGAIGVTWTAPLENTDGSAIVLPMTYNLYRSHGGGKYLRIRSNLKTPYVLVTGEIVGGVRDCFEITATQADNPEAEPSRPTCIVLPTPP